MTVPSPSRFATVFAMGVTVTCRSAPSRSTVSVIGRSGEARTAVCTWVQESHAVGSSDRPSTAVMVSPGRRPASAAGLAAGSAQSPSPPGTPGRRRAGRHERHGAQVEVGVVLQPVQGLRVRGRRRPGPRTACGEHLGADGGQRDGEQHDGQQQVVQRPGRHHHDPLPPRLLVEHPVAVGGQHVVQRGPADLGDEAAHPGGALALALLGRRDHADDADVAAQRDPLHAVLGLALRRENSVGPKPTMNCGTRMPNFRAQ